MNGNLSNLKKKDILTSVKDHQFIVQKMHKCVLIMTDPKVKELDLKNSHWLKSKSSNLIKPWKKLDYKAEKYFWLPPHWELKLCTDKHVVTYFLMDNIQLFKWKTMKSSFVVKDQQEIWHINIWQKKTKKFK